MLAQIHKTLFKAATMYAVSPCTFLVKVPFFPKLSSVLPCFPESFLHTGLSISGNCWSCQRTLPDCVFFCDCGKIQQVSKACNYFELFGYKGPVAKLDRSDLSDRMKALQRKLHPDKHVLATQHELELAADASSLINLAYTTLQSPEERFEYILRLKGFLNSGDINQDGAAVDFLSCFLDLTEDVHRICDELAMVGVSDDPFPDETYHLTLHVINVISKNIDELYQSINGHLEKEEWKKADMNFFQFRYFLRILERLQVFQDALNKLNIKLPIFPK